ncbi:MAG: hypothetical protein H6565_06195 [Lewinellaceae bacterium]|nr:hypothetical protein [Lewinellaceae bacterium]
MKHRIVLFLLAALLPFAACKDEDPVTNTNNFTLTFRALYDGVPLEKYTNYSFGDKQVLYDKFNTFISNISLIKDGQEVLLSDIEWVNFTPDSAPDDRAVEVSFKYSVPDGDYTGLKLGYGVRADLNAKKPSDYPVGHPLYLETEYWPGWSSYIFTKVQGKVDLDGDNTPETSIFYHCGSDAVYNEATMNRTIRVAGDAALVVEFDLKKLFTFNGQLLDLTVPSNQVTSHDASNIALGQKVMDNFKNATILQ